MKRKTITATTVIILCSTAASAFAYTLKTAKGEIVTSCDKEQRCDVFCNNGVKAGSMTWNGSVWADDQRSDKDEHVVAKKIVEANGTACE